jgi:pimeloyl-ACP methyl ester carboxylesterase
MRFLIAFAVSLSLSAASVDGIKIHSTVTGKGPRTVILVHGYTCDESTWTEQVPALAQQYRVVTLDLPGHGKSEMPRDGQFSIDLFARAVEAVRAEVKADRVILIGHSMGTPVIVKYAQLYTPHVAAMIFVDGLMTPYSSGPPSTARGAAMGGPDGPKNRETMVRGFFAEATTPALQARILKMMLAAPEATAVGAMNATVNQTGSNDYVLNMPVLGIYASRPLAQAATIKAHFPNSNYVQIAGTGHFLMLEKPEEFNRLMIEFVGKQKF